MNIIRRLFDDSENTESNKLDERMVGVEEVLVRLESQLEEDRTNQRQIKKDLEKRLDQIAGLIGSAADQLQPVQQVEAEPVDLEPVIKRVDDLEAQILSLLGQVRSGLETNELEERRRKEAEETIWQERLDEQSRALQQDLEAAITKGNVDIFGSALGEINQHLARLREVSTNAEHLGKSFSEQLRRHEEDFASSVEVAQQSQQQGVNHLRLQIQALGTDLDSRIRTQVETIDSRVEAETSKTRRELVGELRQIAQNTTYSEEMNVPAHEVQKQLVARLEEVIDDRRQDADKALVNRFAELRRELEDRDRTQQESLNGMVALLSGRIRDRDASHLEEVRQLSADDPVQFVSRLDAVMSAVAGVGEELTARLGMLSQELSDRDRTQEEAVSGLVALLTGSIRDRDAEHLKEVLASSAEDRAQITARVEAAVSAVSSLGEELTARFGSLGQELGDRDHTLQEGLQGVAAELNALIRDRDIVHLEEVRQASADGRKALATHMEVVVSAGKSVGEELGVRLGSLSQELGERDRAHQEWLRGAMTDLSGLIRDREASHLEEVREISVDERAELASRVEAAVSAGTGSSEELAVWLGSLSQELGQRDRAHKEWLRDAVAELSSLIRDRDASRLDETRKASVEQGAMFASQLEAAISAGQGASSELKARLELLSQDLVDRDRTSQASLSDMMAELSSLIRDRDASRLDETRKASVEQGAMFASQLEAAISAGQGASSELKARLELLSQDLVDRDRTSQASLSDMMAELSSLIRDRDTSRLDEARKASAELGAIFESHLEAAVSAGQGAGSELTSRLELLSQELKDRDRAAQESLNDVIGKLSTSIRDQLSIRQAQLEVELEEFRKGSAQLRDEEARDLKSRVDQHQEQLETSIAAINDELQGQLNDQVKEHQESIELNLGHLASRLDQLGQAHQEAILQAAQPLVEEIMQAQTRTRDLLKDQQEASTQLHGELVARLRQDLEQLTTSTGEQLQQTFVGQKNGLESAAEHLFRDLSDQLKEVSVSGQKHLGQFLTQREADLQQSLAGFEGDLSGLLEELREQTRITGGQLGRGLIRLGELLAQQSGREKEINEIYLWGIEILQRLYEEKPENRENAIGLAQLRVALGELEARDGNRAAASKNIGLGLNLWEDLATLDPDAIEYTLGLARALVAMAEQTEDGAERIAASRRGVEVWERLCAENPAELAHQEQLTRILSSLADQVDATEKLAVVRREMGVWENLCAAKPAEPAYWEGLARTLSALADQLGADQDSLSFRKHGAEVWEKLYAEFPAELAYREELARTLSTLGAQVGAGDEGISIFRRGIELWQGLSEEYPSETAYQVSLAKALSALADQLDPSEEMVSICRRAVEVWERLYALAPSEREYLESLAQRLAQLLDQSSEHDEGPDICRRGMEVWEQLCATSPLEVVYRDGFARMVEWMAAVCDRRGQADEAEGHYRRAIEILESLNRENPDDIALANRYLGGLLRLGDLYSSWGRLQEAETIYGRAIDVGLLLLAEQEHDVECESMVAGLFARMGDLYADAERLQEAEQTYAYGLEILADSYSASPERVSIADGLASLLTNMGALLLQLGRPEEAEAACSWSVEIWEALYSNQPTNETLRIKLADICHNLGLIQHDLGRRQEAAVVMARYLELEIRDEVDELREGARLVVAAAKV